VFLIAGVVELKGWVGEGDKDKAREKREQLRAKTEEKDYLPGFLTNVGEYEVREGVNSRWPGRGADG